jgi:spermidine/putrescine transport system substrate-binding protein
MPRRRPSRPLSPEATAVVRAMARSAGAGPSRRSVLGGAGALGIGALLAACGSDSGGLTSTSAQGAPAPAKDLSASEKVVNWANWTLYLDKSDDGKTYPTLDAFQKKTGIKPAYEEVIEDNDSYYAKVQAQLHKGQDIGADVVVLTDWMASRLIREGLVQAFDQGSMRNTKNLIPALRDVSYDPGRKRSITWQSGFAGIAYNKTKVPELKTVDDLWRADLKGGVEVLTEWRDTLGLIMRSQGVDISKPFTLHTFDNALQVLEKNLADGQIRQVKGNSYKEDLISGDAVAVMAWSGDIFQLNAENGNKWQFVLPESGATLFSDNLMIPIGAPHKKNAETLIDYYYDPKVAAEVAAYVNYICPVQGAKEEMKKIDKDLATSPLIFPSEAELNNAQVFTKLDPTLETLCTEAFESTLGF